MPALPNVPNVVRHTLKGVLDNGANVVNRFYNLYGGTPGSLTNADALAWANTLASAWSTHLKPSINPTYTLTETSTEDLSSPTGAVGVHTLSLPGTNSGVLTPASTCCVVQEKIYRRYRGGHPRQYLAGIGEAGLSDSGNFTSAFLSAILSSYSSFRSAVLAGVPSGLAPASDVSVSFYAGFTNVTYPSGRVRPRPTLRSTPLVDPIASFAINPRVASQRRRDMQSA